MERRMTKTLRSCLGRLEETVEMYADRIEDHKRKGQSRRKEEFRRHPLTGSCRQRSTIPQKKSEWARGRNGGGDE